MGWSLPAQVGASRAPLEAFENREAAYQFRDPMDMSYICHMMSIIVSTSFIVQLEDVFHVITSRELVWNMEGKCLSAHTQQSQCHTSKQEVLNFQALRSDFVVLRAVFTMINENALWRISTPSCLHLKSPSDQIRHTPALQAFCAALSKAWDSGGTYQQHPATTKQTKPFEVPRWSQVIPGDPRWSQVALGMAHHFEIFWLEGQNGQIAIHKSFWSRDSMDVQFCRERRERRKRSTRLFSLILTS